MLSIALIVTALISLACIIQPRWMLSACVLAGYFQDPLRKIIAGEPVFIILIVGVVFAAGTFGYLLRNGFSSIFEIQFWTPEFKVPMLLFFFLVVFHSLFSYLSYANPILTVIGLMAYFSPLLAISISYFSIRKSNSFERLLWFYSTIAIMLALTVVLSFLGYEHVLLKEVGDGLLIYDQGTILRAHAGFMRSSEIAGWHMGAAACFLIVLSFSSGKRSSILFCSIAIMILLIAIALTGRRKMIMQFFIFLSLYSMFYLYFRRAMSTQILAAIALVLFSLWVISVYVFPSLSSSEIDLYYARGISVFGDANERFRELGIGSISWAINRVGWFGGGVGIASQGTGSLGVNIAGGAGEGGLGKIVAELGVPGLLICAWLAWMTFKFFIKTLHFVSKNDSFESRFAIGIVAFVTANIPTYIVASQVYGDLYVLILLGFLIGFVFALPKIMFIKKEIKRKQAEMMSEELT